MPRLLLFLVAICVCFVSLDAIASELWWDPVYRALNEAGTSLSKGADRMAVAERLSVEVRAAPDSRYFARGRQLVFDLQRAAALSESAVNEQRAPAKRLVESNLPYSLLQYRGNERALLKFRDSHPEDPAAELLGQGRAAIPELLAQLRETAATRSSDIILTTMNVPRVARSCDLALLLIENISGCRFHFNASTGLLFHELSKDDRDRIIDHVQQWWAENRANSVADGIKWQIPHGEFYEKADMAERLIAIGGASGTDDDEHGMRVLHQMFRESWGGPAANIANRLARYGDLSPVDVFYDRWRDSLEKPGRIYDSSVVFYVAKHGNRREWELLYELSRRELEQGLRPWMARIWTSLMNSDSTSPYMTPCLGLILSELDASAAKESSITTLDGSHSYEERVVGKLQSLTGEEFGYDRQASRQQKQASIKRARDWWSKTGRFVYSFDRIEARISTAK